MAGGADKPGFCDRDRALGQGIRIEDLYFRGGVVGVSFARDARQSYQVVTSSAVAVPPYRSVLLSEGEGNYYTVRTADGEAFRCRSALSAAEELVAGYDSFRIHQG